LYATAVNAQNVYKFDNKGNRIGPFGSGYNQDPESIVFDKNVSCCLWTTVISDMRSSR
jgi:hypothetical protein